MSVPKKRSPSRARKTRASHHALKAIKLTTCSKCQEPVKPHQVCQSCGFYKGRDVLNLEAKLTKKELKKKQKKEALEVKEEKDEPKKAKSKQKEKV